MHYWHTLTSMTGRTIHSRAEPIVTGKSVPGTRNWLWQGRLRTHYFLRGKPQTRAATMEPCMARLPAASGQQSRSPRLPLLESRWGGRQKGSRENFLFTIDRRLSDVIAALSAQPGVQRGTSLRLRDLNLHLRFSAYLQVSLSV